MLLRNNRELYTTGHYTRHLSLRVTNIVFIIAGHFVFAFSSSGSQQKAQTIFCKYRRLTVTFWSAL